MIRRRLVLPLVITAVMLGAGVGCHTSDASRLETKANAYRASAIDSEKKSQTATTQRDRVRWLEESVQQTDKEIVAIQRIDPSTFSEYQSGTMTLEQAEARKAGMLSAAQARLESYRKQLRDLGNS